MEQCIGVDLNDCVDRCIVLVDTLEVGFGEICHCEVTSFEARCDLLQGQSLEWRGEAHLGRLTRSTRERVCVAWAETMRTLADKNPRNQRRSLQLADISHSTRVDRDISTLKSSVRQDAMVEAHSFNCNAPRQIRETEWRIERNVIKSPTAQRVN